MADELKQAHIFYTGRVQGVGFRYTVQEAARYYQAQGWVRNLRDGRVELRIVGPEAVLTALLDAVRHGPLASCIEEAQVTWTAAAESYSGFEIRPTADGA